MFSTDKMSVQNILDENGKIDPAYIPDLAPFGYVRNPLTAPLQCFNPTTLTNHPIVEAGYVSASAVKTDNLEQLPGSLETQIRCATNIEMASNKQLDFETNALLTIGGNASRKAFYTEDATPLVGFAKYFMGGGNAVEYAESTKVLTINKPTVPPSPLLPGQGVVIYGGLSMNGTLDMSGNEIINCADITVKGSVPGINFQNSAGSAEGDLTYIELIDTLRLQSSKVLINTNNSRDYIIAMNEGTLNQFEISAKDKPIRIIRNDATGLAPDTELVFEAAGKAKLTSAVSDPVSLRLENTGGKGGEIIASESGGFLAVQALAGYSLTMESTNGNVNIATGLPDTTLTASVNGGSAVMTLADTAGVGSVDIASSGNISLSNSANATSATIALSASGLFGAPRMDITINDMGITSGAGEGVNMGGNGSLNFIAGQGTGAPMALKQDYYDAKAISLQSAPNLITVNADDGSVLLSGASGSLGLTLNAGTNTIDVNIGVGLSGSVVKFGTGSINIESDFGVGAPVLSLIDTGSGNGGTIDFGINTLNIGTTTGNVAMYAPAGISQDVGGVATLNMNSTGLTTIVGVNPLSTDQTLTTTFDPANNISLTINDLTAATGATIDMFVGGEIALSATGVLNQTADSANLSITNDLTMSAAQTIVSGGGVRFAKSAMNVSSAGVIPFSNYAITYTQVGLITRTLPEVTVNNVGQKLLITYNGNSILTLGAFGTQLIFANGSATNTKAITPGNTYELTAIQTTIIPVVAYGWSMVGGQTTPLVWGSFSSTATQTATLANTTYFASYTTSDVTAQNCSFSGTEITISQICSKLRIQASLIVATVSPTSLFRFWLVKNGVNVANTGSLVSIKDSGQKLLVVCEWYVSAAVGDKFKVAYQSDTAGSTLAADGAGGTAPNDYSASPSIITTVQAFQ